MLTANLREENRKEEKERIKKEAYRFEMVNNELYYKHNNKLLKYIQFSDRVDNMEHFHKSFGHLGADSVKGIMEERVWWPKMINDIKIYIGSCKECLISTNQSTNFEPLHSLIPAKRPFSRWSLDFIGRLPTTKNGNQWILVAVDHLTSWPIAKAYPDSKEETVAKFIYEEICG